MLLFYQKYKNRINYQTIITLLSVAENIQNVILTWLLYKYINNTIAISLLTFVNYFPTFLSIVTLILIADVINPIIQFYVGNIILIISYLSIFFLFNIKLNIYYYIYFILFIQMIFSFIKASNKVFTNKFVKIFFKKKKREKIIQISFTVIQFFQSLGSLIGNIFIIFDYTLHSFIFISGIYLINLLYSIYLFKSNKHLSNQIYDSKNKSNKIKISYVISWIKKLSKNPKLLMILIISIIFSGIYQYLITVLPFLTSLINLDNHTSFFLLNFFCTFLSSITGVLLYKDIFSETFIKKYNIFVCLILLLSMSFFKKFYILLILNSLCFGALSVYVIYIQTETNKHSNYSDLGKFIVLRNSISSLSKIIFSFISAFIYNHTNLYFVYMFPFLVLLIFFYFKENIENLNV